MASTKGSVKANKARNDKLSEIALINKIRELYFNETKKFCASGDFKHIDFTVSRSEQQMYFDYDDDYAPEYYLWAEAKREPHAIEDMLAQLVLTIGVNHIHEKHQLPRYLGAFDNEKIAFVDSSSMNEILTLNDMDWTATPCDYSTPAFAKARDAVKKYFAKKITVFSLEKDAADIKNFIAKNFKPSSDRSSIIINKNNFVYVYRKWCENVKPTIRVDWDVAKKSYILDSDFYLADLFVDEEKGATIQENLKVILENTNYKINRRQDEAGFLVSASAEFKDEQKAYNQFWNRYKRPPRKEFWNYILSRRDLLVPQDVRERKGAFFTPPQWSDLSKDYLAKTLGQDWQNDYFIWDCCCGTGNLEIGLTNRPNIFASTLDKADVNIIHQMIDEESVKNLFKNQVFQFDFLNDDFTAQRDGGKLPDALADIINDPEKRKKLVIYINPPYAEAGNARTISGDGEHKAGVSKENATYKKYKTILGKASNELFAQFFMRIYQELSGCILGQFSTLKALVGDNFKVFRQNFDAELKSLFIVPGDSFDNVGGKFPIGFFIWDLSKHVPFTEIVADVKDKSKNISTKTIRCANKKINAWVKQFYLSKNSKSIGVMGIQSPDFQQTKYLCIENFGRPTHVTYATINELNLLQFSIYFAVRHAIPATWLNDRDQFLYPNDGWKADEEFQNDCLMFTLFHGQNRISSEQGENHWNPFTEEELEIKCSLNSTFMRDFIAGRMKVESCDLLGEDVSFIPTKPLQFSDEALAVRSAALEVFRYYYEQPNAPMNVSLYDVKTFFRGRSATGRMNPTSPNAHLNSLMVDLRCAMKALAAKIEPKIYAYGFLA